MGLGGSNMIYPFMKLNDKTEIVHSEMKPDGTVKVYMERPDAKDGFHHATCWLPAQKWEDVFGFSDSEMNYLKDFINSISPVIIELSQTGGFDNAANF